MVKNKCAETEQSPARFRLTCRQKRFIRILIS